MMRLLVLVVCGGLFFPMAARAQTPAPDPIRELLTEVRALRMAMERAATVGARIQLLVARVQLQEQRIAELSRRATTVREELSRLDAEAAQMATMIRQFEGAGSSANPEQRADIEGQIERFRAQSGVIEKRRQDLANEEALLAQQLATDQGRWTDVNSQLDELERSLAPPKP